MKRMNVHKVFGGRSWTFMSFCALLAFLITFGTDSLLALGGFPPEIRTPLLQATTCPGLAILIVGLIGGLLLRSTRVNFSE